MMLVTSILAKYFLNLVDRSHITYPYISIGNICRFLITKENKTRG